MNSEVELTDLLLNKTEKIDQICRVCLSENTEQSKCVFDENESSCIASVLMLCARVQIACQDGLPDIICVQCLGDLEAANNFRLRCELSDSLLRKYSKAIRSSPKRPDRSVKAEVPEEWIKLELKDDDSDDPLIQNSLFAAKALNNINISTQDEQSLNESDSILNNDDLECNTDCSDDKLSEVKSKPFVCNICGKPLCSKKSLENHLHKMHSENKTIKHGKITGYGKGRKFHCSECSYSTPRRSDFIYHCRIHTGEKPYKCDKCQACFSQSGSLSSHKRAHSDQMDFTCQICGKQFRQRYTLERHKRIHNDTRYPCEICSKGLTSRQNLAVHMKRHLNIREFSCEQCGRTFVSAVDLLNHARKHVDVKRFECHICGLKIKTKRGVVTHVRRHTGEKTAKCDLCDYSTFNIYSLKTHMKKHTREKNYSCPVCDIKFIHSTSVNKHMRRIHKIEYKFNDHIDRRVIK